jgi:hypothetical protein
VSYNNVLHHDEHSLIKRFFSYTYFKTELNWESNSWDVLHRNLSENSWSNIFLTRLLKVSDRKITAVVRISPYKHYLTHGNWTRCQYAHKKENSILMQEMVSVFMSRACELCWGLTNQIIIQRSSGSLSIFLQIISPIG